MLFSIFERCVQLCLAAMDPKDCDYTKLSRDMYTRGERLKLALARLALVFDSVCDKRGCGSSEVGLIDTRKSIKSVMGL